MDAAVKEQWLKDLRSGEFEQGTCYLERDQRFCCLGVLCYRAAQAAVVERVVHPDGVVTYDGFDSLPPKKVLEWARMDTDSLQGAYEEDSGTHWLSADNDMLGYGFTEIADTIDEHF
jgi:hypothetical protein